MVGGVQRLVVLPLLFCAVTSQAQQPSETAPNSDTTTTVSSQATRSGIELPRVSLDSTCVSRTINHITHNLPQQCLRTDRVSPSVPRSDHGETHTGTASSYSLPDAPDHASTAPQVIPTDTPAVATSSDQISVTSSAPANSQESPAPSASDDKLDADSPLDNVNFLSFEEWKKQNLAKAGQSPETVGRKPDSGLSGRARPGLYNALDSLGEESEIDIDFGFGSSTPTTDQPSDASTRDERVASDSVISSTAGLRSKDAGKTCKERTNYASFDCAATILKTNPECKSASSILVEHKDSYMLNICSASNKFLIVELCDDILVDTIVLANFEFFSSIFRQFRVSVSDRYPVKAEKWRDLGTFEARNTREIQAFLIESPLIWAKYLRVEFLTHYGNEYYCPVSLLRVHGTTMMEEFRHHEELPRDSSDEETTFASEIDAVSTESIPAKVLSGDDEGHSIPSVPQSDASKVSDVKDVDTASDPQFAEEPSQGSVPHTQSARNGNASSTASPTDRDEKITESPPITSVRISDNSSVVGMPPPSSTYARSDAASTTAQSQLQSTSNNHTMSTPGPSGTPTHLEAEMNKTGSTEIAAATAESVAQGTDHVAISAVVPPTENTTIPSGNSTKSAMTPTVSTAQASAQPTTQESFFKSVHKRLQQLESNSTLSLQYIEEQSRILRDAFNKVEKRQSNTALTFLSHLNDTVMNELTHYRQAYDQLWQGTVLELESHREQHQREMLVLSSRLTMVADELLWQKRMGMLQSTLLLLALGLVLFTRHSNGSLEVPLLQQVMTKSHAALRTGWDSDPGSPSPASRRPVSMLRRRAWWPVSENEPASGGDEGSTHIADRPELSVHIDPPSPESAMKGSDDDDYHDSAHKPALPTPTSMRSEEWDGDPPVPEA